MTAKLASVSVDLDEVGCYAAIHGVRIPEGAGRHAVYDRCLPRLTALFDAEGIRGTFFAIGADLRREENSAAVRDLHLAGHEVANHSFHHRYDLSRRPKEVLREDIARGSDAISELTGTKPLGFRAPGYTMTDEIFDVLEEMGVLYDSSVFPCPSYYATKLAALGWIKARGRASHSVIDRPQVLMAPKAPYRVGRPYWRRGDGLLEIPIGVTRWGLPFIGTALVLLGDRRARRLTRQMLAGPVLHLELHGFDVADAALDGLEALAPHRPDLRKRAEDKLATLRATLGLIRGAGYEIVPLRSLARSARHPAR